MWCPLAGHVKVPIPSGEAGVKDTLERMAWLVRSGDLHVEIKERARRIVDGIPPNDYHARARAVAHWVRDALPYCHDIYGVEEISAPQVILRNLRDGRQGYSSDCDDHSILAAALLRSIGFKVRFAALAVKSPRYNHVRPEVFLGIWTPMEPTMKNRAFGFGLPSTREPIYQGL